MAFKKLTVPTSGFPVYLRPSIARVIGEFDIKGSMQLIWSVTLDRDLGMARNDDPIKTFYFKSSFPDAVFLPDQFERFRIAFSIQGGYTKHRLYRSAYYGSGTPTYNREPELFLTEDAVLSRVFAREQKLRYDIWNIEMTYAEKEQLAAKALERITAM
jgi:hypothetical protein